MSLRHAVLGILAECPASGYDLVKMFELSLDNVWSATQSQIYTELGRLADTGMVTVAAAGPRGRKEYEITGAGRAELRRWLTEVEPVGVRRNDMLVRVFFLGQLDVAAAREYMRRRAAHAAEQQQRLTDLAKIVDKGESDFSVHARLALEWGLRLMAMEQEWATWAEDQLKGSKRGS